MQHVHRGRRIVAAYAVLHLIVTAVILVVGWRIGAKLTERALGAVFHTMLVHQLWRGSRWAQWLHVLYFAGWSLALALFAMLFFKRPHPFFLVVGVPAACLFAWLAITFAFSRCIREFLAHQREHYAEKVRQASASRPVAQPAPALAMADGAWEDDEPRTDERATSPCRSCGLELKHFVLLCPECGTRREALA